jgi:Fe-Mn family superoxide dismutase
MSNRRNFFKKIGVISLSGLATKLSSNNRFQLLNEMVGQTNRFTLPKLAFAYNALEPFIDEQTMIIHHTKHHQGYIDKLNAMQSTNIDFLVDDVTKCRQLVPLPNGNINLRNNLGGHVNHTFFWELLKPNKNADINLPKGTLAEAINKDFKSFDEFKKQFSESATKHFGSGWCWLINQNGKLKITTTPNQDNPLMKANPSDELKNNIILALDVWEHAYYLKYQNKRVEYITNWWNIVNWEKAEELYIKSKS